MRRVVALLAIALAASAAYLVIRSETKYDDESTTKTPRSTGVESTSSPATAVSEAVAPATRLGEPIHEADGGTGPASVENLSKKGDDDIGGEWIEGTVVVTDADGVEHAQGNGAFTMQYSTSQRPLVKDSIEVAGGRFRTRAPAGIRFDVESLVVDGDVALAVPDACRIDSHVALCIRARRARDVLLHVVDAITREELLDVTLLETTGEDSSDGRPIAEHRSSPISLRWNARGGWTPELSVKSPRHARGFIQIDHGKGGDATLELSRGGALEVTLVGKIPSLPNRKPGQRDVPLRRPMIRLRCSPYPRPEDVEAEVVRTMESDARIPDESWKEFHRGQDRPTEKEVRQRISDQLKKYVENPCNGFTLDEKAPTKEGPTRFDDVPLLPLVVTAESGPDSDRPLLLAHAEILVAEGDVTRVTLDLSRFEDSRTRVPFSGTVYCSDAWGSKSPSLRFDPMMKGSAAIDEFNLRDLVRVDARPGLYRFDAGRVLCGAYILTVSNCDYRQLIDTGPDGTDHAEIVIADPADVVIHVVDDDVGRPLEFENGLYWWYRRPDCGGATGQECDWDESIHAARMRAPAGDLELSLSSKQAREFEIAGSRFIQVSPGSNDFTVRLRTVAFVGLRATIDGVGAPWPEPETARFTSLEASDDPGSLSRPWESSETELGFYVGTSRRYRVHVPKLPGFDPVVPFEVEARKGERVVATVALRRSK